MCFYNILSMESSSCHNREYLKDIRTMDNDLSKLQSTQDTLAIKLKEAIKKQRNIEEAQRLYDDIQQEIREKEAHVICEKRRLWKQALHVKMDGIIEMSSKCSIAASYGKYLADQIPQGKLSPGQQLPPYTGRKYLSICDRPFNQRSIHALYLTNSLTLINHFELSVCQ